MSEDEIRSGPPRKWSQVRVYRRLIEANAFVLQRTREFVEADCGLTLSEFDMLAELGNQPAKRMGDLAARILVSPANATRIAQALAAKGILVRERGKQSEREVFARLTPEGQAMFERHFPAAASFVGDLVDERLTADEQATLADLLAKLGRP